MDKVRKYDYAEKLGSYKEFYLNFEYLSVKSQYLR